MKLTRKSGLLAFALLALGSLGAIAAGSYSTLPIVGGAQFCSTVSGVTLPTSQGPFGVVPGSTQGSGQGVNQNCVPAGPPSLTGAEKFPADTQLANGAPPQTVVVTTCQLAGGSYSIVSTAVGVSTDTIANQVCYYIIDGTSTISAETVTMPSAPLDGQLLRVSCTFAVTTLTMSANTGQTLKGGATSCSANAEAGAWIYKASTATWYRV